MEGELLLIQIQLRFGYWEVDGEGLLEHREIWRNTSLDAKGSEA